jgi:hypothetical protein
MSSTTRVQFNVPDHKLAELDEMQDKLGLSTRKDLFDNAMTLLRWAIQEKERGRTITAVGEEGSQRELVMPALEAVTEAGFEKRLFKVARELGIGTDKVVDFLTDQGYEDALTGSGFNASIADREAYLALRREYNRASLRDSEREEIIGLEQQIAKLSETQKKEIVNELGLREGSDEDDLLICEGRGARATARYERSGTLVVRQGSTAAREATDAGTRATEIREELKEKGVLQANSDNTALVFMRDEKFSSPSSAARAVLGRSANGRVEWKTKDGRTLKQLQE